MVSINRRQGPGGDNHWEPPEKKKENLSLSPSALSALSSLSRLTLAICNPRVSTIRILIIHIAAD